MKIRLAPLRLALAAAVSTFAQTENHPTRPIRLIVPYAPDRRRMGESPGRHLVRRKQGGRGRQHRRRCRRQGGARRLHDRRPDRFARHQSVVQLDADNVLLYADLHPMNEYTSPQAFAGLHERGLKTLHPGQNVATVSHIIPTHADKLRIIADGDSVLQASKLKRNCERHGIPLFDTNDRFQGIEHVIAPEHGMIRPGMVVICGDSHTTTYGALGALGFGIGTTEVEHLRATQTLVYRLAGDMRIRIDGALPAMVVPGSGAVREQAEREGIAAQLISASFEWRKPGCSMCLAMNDDVLAPGTRCASTTNRDFEGRQGRGAITHLMSPAMAAAAAVTGKITDVRTLLEQ